jgi:ribosome recycling factor
MAEPKKQSSPRKTGTRRSHLVLKLARRVNGTSPVKVRTTKRETGKALAKSVKLTAAAEPKAEKSAQKTTKKVAK